MNYNYINPEDKYSYKDLLENTHDFYTESGLIDNFFLDLCKTKIDTDIRGSPINISVIIPNEGGTNQVQINKYFDYAIRNEASIILGKSIYPFIINKEDIGPDIINELESLPPFIAQNIIK